MFKFVTASLLSAALVLAVQPNEAQAGGRGLALGVGLGLGAAVLMHNAHKHQQASRRRAATRQHAARKAAARRAAARKAAARKAAAHKAASQAAYARKKQAAQQAAYARQQKQARLAAIAEQQEQQLLAETIELPGKKPEAIETAAVNNEEETVAAIDHNASYDEVDQDEDTQTVSLSNDNGPSLDCKRYIPSAGLTISVPCAN